MAVGGAAFLVLKAIRSANVVAFEDLGMEAIYEMEVEGHAGDRGGRRWWRLCPRYGAARMAGKDPEYPSHRGMSANRGALLRRVE